MSNPIPTLPAAWLQGHDAKAYGRAMQELLPPGAAWDWPQDGSGFALLKGLGQELARVELEAINLLPQLPQEHEPKVSSWHISTYQAIAEGVVSTVVEPARKPFVAGSHAGDRLWNEHPADFAVAKVQVDHLKTCPFVAGSRAGDRLWSERAKFLIRVRYYAGVVNLTAILKALKTHAQAHVAFWCEDVTTRGGIYATY